jgi:hypothetical protein
MDEEGLNDLYLAMKDSIIDVAKMEDQGINTLKQFIYDRGETGDMLRVRVSLNDNEFTTQATFVKDNSKTQLDNNVFLPFHDHNSEVYIGDSVLQYMNGSVNVNGTSVNYNEPFMLEGRRVVLAKGSVVVIVEDSLLNDFPHDGIQSEIVNNDGVMALGDIVTGNTVLMESKELYGTSSVKSFVFFHDTLTDERTVVCETDKTVDYFNTSCTTTISVYNIDSIEPVIEYSPSGIDIRSSLNGVESVATMNNTGLSFSSDDSAVMLGDTSQFRIRYNQDSDTIQIQYFDGQDYITKTEYGR